MTAEQRKQKISELLKENDSVKVTELSRLFDRFYRADDSRNSKTGGSGIGLSVAKEIVEAHGGSITAFSKDGKSIDFDVLLPH